MLHTASTAFVMTCDPTLACCTSVKESILLLSQSSCILGSPQPVGWRNRLKIALMSAEHILVSRLPFDMTKIVTAVLFGVAIVTSIGRSYIQFYLLRQFKTEDFFHLLGVVFLIGMTTLYYVTMQTWYEALNILTGGLAALTPENIQLVDNDLGPFAKQQSAMTILAIAIVFWIKLAYMALFYRLIGRVKHIYIYWWLIMVSTVWRHALLNGRLADWKQLIGGVVCLVCSLFGCPPWLTVAELGKITSLFY
jgi:hypothetical protein